MNEDILKLGTFFFLPKIEPAPSQTPNEAFRSKRKNAKGQYMTLPVGFEPEIRNKVFFKAKTFFFRPEIEPTPS
jgi:hypothetical protein